MNVTDPVGALVTSGEEPDDVATILSFIEAHESRHGAGSEPAFYLSGSSEHDRVELTEQLHMILKQAAQALGKGQSISILARDEEISTQQAADVLGLSRPTVVRLINEGELSAQVPGTVRRKLKLIDVIEYRDALKTRREKFIADSSAEYSDVDTGDVGSILEEARRQAR